MTSKVRFSKTQVCLWFANNDALEAAQFYCSLFEDSSLVGKSGNLKAGEKPMTVTFKLGGIEYMGLNGGPHFKLNEACSIMIFMNTQDELDRVWNALLDGGKASQCGWLVDKFGVSWQVVPTMFMNLMETGEREKCDRMMSAMMGMVKMNIAELQAAYDGTAQPKEEATKKRQREDDDQANNGNESKK